jgi:hypothetical protein
MADALGLSYGCCTYDFKWDGHATKGCYYHGPDAGEYSNVMFYGTENGNDITEAAQYNAVITYPDAPGYD